MEARIEELLAQAERNQADTQATQEQTDTKDGGKAEGASR